MKDKLYSAGSCMSIFASNRQTSFGSTSPVTILSDPSNLKFFYWAGSITNTTAVGETLGTIGMVRDDVTLKHYQWLVTSTGTPTIVRVAEIPKENVVNPLHHFSALPQTLSNYISDLENKNIE